MATLPTSGAMRTETSCQPRQTQTGYAPVNGLEHVLRGARRGPAAAPAARRLHDDRHDGAAAPGARRDAAGDRRRAAGPRPHGRHRPADHLRADGGRHGRADPPPRPRARPTSIGYSMGGGVALQLAIRHPDAGPQARRRVGGLQQRRHAAVALEMFPSITPEMFAGSPDRGRPTSAPRRTPATSRCWSRSSPGSTRRRSRGRRRTSAAIAAPTLIVLGDSDGVRLEHAVELFKLRGGGVMGDLAGPAAVAARSAARHRPLRPARVRAPGPRRVAAGDDPAVPRRAAAGARGLVAWPSTSSASSRSRGHARRSPPTPPTRTTRPRGTRTSRPSSGRRGARSRSARGSRSSPPSSAAGSATPTRSASSRPASDWS